MGFFVSFLWLLLAMVISGCTERSSSPREFAKKAEWAANAFPAPLMTQEEFRDAETDVLLVDTRSPEEFAVSRLPGAINWPDYQDGDLPKEVLQHAEAGKPVVFYCSIGYRSGDAAVRAEEFLGPKANVFNLRGGIFQWANEGGGLEGGDRVHGFDEEWGRLLRPELRAPTVRPAGD